jgi:hypothetical protein
MRIQKITKKEGDLREMSPEAGSSKLADNPISLADDPFSGVAVTRVIFLFLNSFRPPTSATYPKPALDEFLASSSLRGTQKEGLEASPVLSGQNAISRRE